MNLNTILFYNPISPYFQMAQPSQVPWGLVVGLSDSWADLDVCQQPNGNLLMLKIKPTSNLSPRAPIRSFLFLLECCSLQPAGEEALQPWPPSPGKQGWRSSRFSPFMSLALDVLHQPRVGSPQTCTNLEGDRKEPRSQSPVPATSFPFPKPR